MKEKIVYYVTAYAPVLFMLVMMVIDKLGFGNLFSAFRSDVTKAFDTKAFRKEIQEVKDELRSSSQEIKEVREEIKQAREAITKIKGAKK